jgi:hypothetical protein
VYKIYFWVSYCRPWFLWPETKKLVIPLLRIYLFASLLSVHCVSPHWRSHKLRRISTLKPNIIFCDYLFDHNLSLRMDHQFKKIARRCRHWRFQVSLQGKIFPVPTLFFASLLEGEQRLSMGEELGTVQF